MTFQNRRRFTQRRRPSSSPSPSPLVFFFLMIVVGEVAWTRNNVSSKLSLSFSCPLCALAFVPTTTARAHNRIQTTTTTPTTTTTLWKRKPRQVVLGEGTEKEDMPANLKRKIKARRPALGHIVPRRMRTKGSGGSANPKLRPQGKAREAGMNNPSLLKILGGTARGRRLDSPQVYLRPMMGKVKEAVMSTFTSFGFYSPEVSTRHLDIFAGSGSVGLESLSRGASHCTFVDFSQDCCQAIQRNINWCGFNTNNNNDDNDTGGETTTTTTTTRVICADAFDVLSQNHQHQNHQNQQEEQQPSGFVDDNMHDSMHNNNMMLEGEAFQIVTLCPPYEEVVYADLLHAVANSPLVREDTIILVEYPVELGCLPHVITRQDGGKVVGVRNRRYGRTVIAMYIVNPTGELPNAESRPEEFVTF